jgi:hypothetical protein
VLNLPSSVVRDFETAQRNFQALANELPEGGVSDFMRTLMDDADAKTAHSTLNIGNGFRAYHSHTTGAYANGAVIIFNNENYDDNGAYNPATGIFTAPFAGRWHFDWSVYKNGVPAGAGSYWQTQLITGAGIVCNGDLYYTDLTYYPVSNGAATVPMVANETARIQIAHGLGGTHALYSPTQDTYFNGELVRRV